MRERINLINHYRFNENGFDKTRFITAAWRNNVHCCRQHTIFAALETSVQPYFGWYQFLYRQASPFFLFFGSTFTSFLTFVSLSARRRSPQMLKLNIWWPYCCRQRYDQFHCRLITLCRRSSMVIRSDSLRFRFWWKSCSQMRTRGVKEAISVRDKHSL